MISIPKSKCSLLVLMLLISLMSLGQTEPARDTLLIVIEYGNRDSVVVKEAGEGIFNYVVGTAFINTANYSLCMDKGIEPQSVTKSNCDQSDEDFLKTNKTEVTYISRIENRLIIDVRLVDNCCYDFLCEAEPTATGELNLIIKGYGAYCFCSCCFGFRLTFDIWHEQDFDLTKVMVNNKRESLTAIPPK
jgi:hypothetical protein